MNKNDFFFRSKYASYLFVDDHHQHYQHDYVTHFDDNDCLTSYHYNNLTIDLIDCNDDEDEDLLPSQLVL